MLQACRKCNTPFDSQKLRDDLCQVCYDRLSIKKAKPKAKPENGEEMNEESVIPEEVISEKSENDSSSEKEIVVEQKPKGRKSKKTDASN